MVEVVEVVEVEMVFSEVLAVPNTMLLGLDQHCSRYVQYIKVHVPSSKVLQGNEKTSLPTYLPTYPARLTQVVVVSWQGATERHILPSCTP